MDILYYPNLYVSDEPTLKALLLFWGDVGTIVPPSIKNWIDSYLAGRGDAHDPSLELVKKVNDIAGRSAVDFVVISDEERHQSTRKMMRLLDEWGADSHFFDQYRIHSIDDLRGKMIEYYWFLHEKLEQPLVQRLAHENLAVNWAPGGMASFKEIGHTYMSILGEEIRRRRNLPLVTDQELFVIPRLYSNYTRTTVPDEVHYDGYQLVGLAVPDVFLGKRDLGRLSFKQILQIRNDVLPLAEAYHSEIASYQERINSLAQSGRSKEAFDLFLELCGRVAISFRPFAREYSKILRFISESKNITLLTGIALPSIKLLLEKADIEKVCEITAISATAANYYIESRNIKGGFEFLSTLNRSIRRKLLANRLHVLVPKVLRR